MKRLILCVLLCLYRPLCAHPVVYEGAWAFTWFGQSQMSDVEVAYSVTSRWALGIDYVRDSMDPIRQEYGIARANVLLKRWNGEDSQANFYIYGGGGLAILPSSTQPALFGGAEVDFETRRIYTSTKVVSRWADRIRTSSMWQGRIGYAPVTADYNGLQLWAILQTQYFPHVADGWRTGPVLRFFYSNFLWEVGVTTQGFWNLTLMLHV